MAIKTSIIRIAIEMKASDDGDDLTNLNWVSGIEVPLPANFSGSILDKKSPRNRNRGSRSPFRELTASRSAKGVETVLTSPRINESASISRNHKNYPTTPLQRPTTIVDESNGRYKRPDCSYACLVGMALKASPGTGGCLPVHEIYQYIE